ncbi:MAG: hypothetical protein ACYCW6_05685 [Candidatus Xenobia bacterium]
MFNQAFFDRDFSRLLSDYAKTTGSEAAAVELVLADGGRYRLVSIEMVGQSWISFRATQDGVENGESTVGQITCPYESIRRINFLSKVAEKRIGFRVTR